MIFNSITNSPAAAAAIKEDEATPATAIAIIKKQKTNHMASSFVEGDGSSIEVAKRPRGRPPGSKNKPKPPIIITREAEPSAAMRPHILEIPAGHDVVDSIVRFTRRKNIGVCVLAGNGVVTNVTLRQPPHPTAGAGAGPATTVGFHGRFEILSLSATVMPPALSAVFAPGASVTLAGPQGQVMGGAIVGPLVAAGTVTVVAATFDNPSFHRLPPAEEEVARSLSVSGGGEDSSGHQQHQQQHQQEQEQEEEEAEEEQQQQHYVHREYQHHHTHHHHNHHQPPPQHHQTVAESCGMSIYSSHFPSEAIWAPTARQPHPPPY